MATRPGWIPVVDDTRCTGCGWCVAACDLHLLSLEVVAGRKTSTLHDAQACTGCSDCALRCPFHVITMRRSGATTPASAGPDRHEAGCSPES